jgi:hypothetical protein
MTQKLGRIAPRERVPIPSRCLKLESENTPEPLRRLDDAFLILSGAVGTSIAVFRSTNDQQF